MAQLYDMVQVVTATTGTGTITLGAAAVADGITYLTFAGAGVPTGAVVSYRIRDGSAWEVGRGTYTSSGTTLTRSLLFSSTGSLLSLSGTGVSVSIVALGEDFADLVATDTANRALIGLGAPSVSWLAGANPQSAVLITTNRALTITGVTCVIKTLQTGALVEVRNGAGTTIHSGTIDLSRAVGTYTHTPTTTTLASGDHLYLFTSGTWPTPPVSVANVTVFVS